MIWDEKKVIEWTKEYLWFQYNHKIKKRDWKDLKSQWYDKNVEVMGNE